MSLRRWGVAGAATLDNVWHALKRLEGDLGRTIAWSNSRIVTASTAILDSDDVLLVATAGGAVTVMLPPAATNLGRRFTVKKMDAHANNVTLDAAETIDGAASLAWNTQYAAYTVQAAITTAPASANWVIV